MQYSLRLRLPDGGHGPRRPQLSRRKRHARPNGMLGMLYQQAASAAAADGPAVPTVPRRTPAAADPSAAAAAAAVVRSALPFALVRDAVSRSDAAAHPPAKPPSPSPQPLPALSSPLLSSPHLVAPRRTSPHLVSRRCTSSHLVAPSLHSAPRTPSPIAPAPPTALLCHPCPVSRRLRRGGSISCTAFLSVGCAELADTTGDLGCRTTPGSIEMQPDACRGCCAEPPPAPPATPPSIPSLAPPAVRRAASQGICTDGRCVTIATALLVFFSVLTFCMLYYTGCCCRRRPPASNARPHGEGGFDGVMMVHSADAGEVDLRTYVTSGLQRVNLLAAPSEREKGGLTPERFSFERLGWLIRRQLSRLWQRETKAAPRMRLFTSRPSHRRPTGANAAPSISEAPCQDSSCESSRFEAALNDLVVGQPEDAALGIRHYMKARDDDVLSRMQQVCSSRIDRTHGESPRGEPPRRAPEESPRGESPRGESPRGEPPMRALHPSPQMSAWPPTRPPARWPSL